MASSQPDSRPFRETSEPRHDGLALRLDSAAGTGPILARGSEALNLYQSATEEGFRGVDGASVTLGRVVENGGFVPLIRRGFTSDELGQPEPTGDRSQESYRPAGSDI